jgi:nucleoside 2-deoxyribosyltransferase
MKCFVIMPFAKTFDDVYVSIKSSVESCGPVGEVMCGRLDERKPAGRITDRLLEALRECAFCVTDLTGCSPNVMWETGYAMALGKPIIIVTQDLSSLPFDVKDILALPYDRNHLRSTLGGPLQEVVRDTLALLKTSGTPAADSGREDQARLVTGLGVQLAELKQMVGQVVQAWSEPKIAPKDGSARVPSELRQLEGAWLNDSSKTNLYVSAVGDRLVAPYCYGNNDSLTAYYYGWQKLGEYFFARFKWVSREIEGFAFFRQTSRDILKGAWWFDDALGEVPSRPLQKSGVQVLWHRIRKPKIPEWATVFFDRVRDGEVAEYR